MKDAKYIAWIKTLECWYCGCFGSDPHHIGDGIHTTRSNDRLVIPLCREHHDMAHRRGWNKHLRAALTKAAKKYWREYESKNL